MNTLKLFTSSLRCAALCALIGAVAASVSAQPPGAASSSTLPAESLYWLPVPLTDAHGKRFDLRDLAGHPVLVTMFYGDCNTACPIIMETLQQTVAALKLPAAKLSVLMVSLDPLHDTPASLAQLGQTHHLDNKIFRLAVSNNDTHTRAMAAALDIKYRALGTGEISHTTRISLLDASGKIVASSTELNTAPDQEFLKKIRLALK
jgi:protein SCO1